jgi:zeaxanthin glucosyltransferase
LLCDQMEAAGGLVAEGLGLPYVSVACALPLNREAQLPLAVMPFAYATDERSQQIFEGSRKVYDWLMRPLGKVLREASRRLAIEPRTGLHECLSPYAQISQTIPGFDFPRQHPPANFHAVGPLRMPPSDQVGEWPIDPAQLDAQLLVAHCGGLDTRQEKRLINAGATWVTDFAPQQWALQNADAVVTHGGLNTVMDAIVARTPMLVMPIAFDQPGVAARVTHAGIGLQLRRGAGAGQIGDRLVQLRGLSAEPFERLASELAQAGGTARAADIIEAVVRTGQPVLAEQFS